MFDDIRLTLYSSALPLIKVYVQKSVTSFRYDSGKYKQPPSFVQKNFGFLTKGNSTP